MFYKLSTDRSALQSIADMSRAAYCAWVWNALFGFEDAVVDLFNVLQARWHRRECKILNVKLAVKYGND